MHNTCKVQDIVMKDSNKMLREHFNKNQPTQTISCFRSLHDFVLDPDFVFEMFSQGGNSNSGFQMYHLNHASRNESRDELKKLWETGQPSIELLKLLSSQYTFIIREAYYHFNLLDEMRQIYLSHFRCHSNTNLYTSRPTSSAFIKHADPHPVFAYQLYGAKNWLLYPDNSITPLEICVSTGDVLFIPQGIQHHAVAVTDFSVHASVSVEVDRS